MLLRTDLSALDVVSAYDKTDDGQLNKKEFLVFIKAVVGDTKLWRESNVKEMTGSVFGAISGDDGELDIEEIVRWLLKGWNERKKKLNPHIYEHDDAWTAAKDAEPENLRVGERLFLCNPYFADGTRLRCAPDRESEFVEGAAIFNDEEVEILMVVPNGFSKIRACENGNTSEGYVRNRNLTRRRRMKGLATVKNLTPFYPRRTADETHVSAPLLNRHSSGLSPQKKDLSGLSPLNRHSSGLYDMMPKRDLSQRSTSLPTLTNPSPGQKSNERSMRHLNYTASRLKEEADDAARCAARAERLFQKRNVAAEYARTAAFAAVAERQRVFEVRRELSTGEGTRRRWLRERERRNGLLNSNDKKDKTTSTLSMGRLPDTGVPNPSMVMIGIPSRGARPFW